MLLATDELIRILLAFRRERDWEQFHTPRNLAASVAIEASELLECFQWARDTEISEIVDRDRELIEDELADLAILMTYLCVDMQVDLDAAIRRKLKKNAEKYPVHLSRGSARKYDRF